MDGTTFKLATWNVNSIRIRMELLKKFTAQENPDVVCIQEVKAKEEDFPFEDVRALGYPHIALYGMAGYNGVCILSKTPLEDVEQKNWVGKTDARHICARVFDDIEINNIYIPAGGDIPDPIANLSFAHKLTFMDDVAEWWEQHQKTYAGRKMIVCGDFNVAPAGKRRLESQTNAENRFAYAGRNRKADKVEKFAELRRRTAQISSRTGKSLFLVELPQSELAD